MVRLKGSSDWQESVLRPEAFKSKAGEALSGWEKADKLQLAAVKPRWTGELPVFSLFKWIK